MSLKQNYSSFVNKLPINPNRKNWLKRNMTGFLAGIIFAGLTFLPGSGLFGFGVLAAFGLIPYIIFTGILGFILNIFSISSQGMIFYLMVGILVVIFYGLLGAFIQSKIRGRH